MDRAQADALARELVARGAFRWVAGMASHSLPHGIRPGETLRILDGQWAVPDGGRLSGVYSNFGAPDLLDPATAACLAVQAMEAGASLEPASADDWLAWTGPGTEPYWSTRGPLGIVAAQALLALRGGDARTTTTGGG